MKKFTFTSSTTNHTFDRYTNTPAKELKELNSTFEYMELDSYTEIELNFSFSGRFPKKYSKDTNFYLSRMEDLSNFLLETNEDKNYSRIEFSGSSTYSGASIHFVNKNHGGVSTVSSFESTADMLSYVKGFTDALYRMKDFRKELRHV